MKRCTNHICESASFSAFSQNPFPHFSALHGIESGRGRERGRMRRAVLLLLGLCMLCGSFLLEDDGQVCGEQPALRYAEAAQVQAQQSDPDAEKNDAAEDFAARWAVGVCGQPDAVRVLLAHELLCRCCTYDRQAPDCHTAYGALIGGRAVCDGYAAAFALLLEAAEVPVRTVTGFAGQGDAQPEPHAWNLVRLDSIWYHIDCTWDDSDEAGVPCSHDYFLCSDAVMQDTHCWDAGKYPPAAGGGYRYESIVGRMIAECQDSFGW